MFGDITVSLQILLSTGEISLPITDPINAIAVAILCVFFSTVQYQKKYKKYVLQNETTENFFLNSLT
jgi:hypothetical protein